MFIINKRLNDKLMKAMKNNKIGDKQIYPYETLMLDEEAMLFFEELSRLSMENQEEEILEEIRKLKKLKKLKRKERRFKK
jgi:hypothetical protein